MKPWLRTALCWSGVSVLLLATFELYRQPDFLLRLANLNWACF
ncbi:hypothetical protein [Hydrogenophaga sp.]|nr:hypothetical protein [Hydrogenophaga sp.]